MNELSPFERRLAAGLEAVAGPRRSIDAIAIARSAASRAPVPSFLSRFVATIGQGADVRGRRLGELTERRRALVMLIAVVLITALAFGALGVGSGLVRVPSVAPSQPDGVSPSPSLSVLTIPSPTASQALLVQSGWSSTGSMSVARAGHTATVLTNGEVLVAGGFDRDCCSASKSLATAEIYDPKSGTWSRTGSMRAARSSHTATLLASGEVLVAGGTFDDRASAELYDPKTGTWSPAGSMTEPRSFHTATLLADGKVLIAGGSGPRGDANGFLATADLYDPRTNTWTAAGKMTTIFGGFHRATLLSDGRVLVLGGYGIPGSQASADLYDPGTGKWSAARSMIAARWNPTATLLEDGRVLVVGGEGGEPHAGIALASAELFDPAVGRWSRTGSMRWSRVAHTATLLRDGRVVVAGGFDINLGVFPKTSSSELYDSRTGTWSDAGRTTQERQGQAATLLPDGRVLFVGGVVGPRELTSSAELFEPAQGG